MPDDAVLNARDAMLVDWLDEAHAQEAKLEADLTNQITLVTKPALAKRLRAHLEETRKHQRSVAERIGQIAGDAMAPDPPAVVSALGEAAGRAMAAVKGQIASRTPTAAREENQVRMAQEQLREEHVAIAIYIRIEALAEEVGDAETAKLARAILRDEQRMAKFLASELPKLVREVVRAEIPRDERPTRRRSRPASAGSARSTRGGSRARSS